MDLSISPYSRSSRQAPWHAPTHPRTKLRGVEDVSTRRADWVTTLTFSDAISLVMGDDRGLDERFEDLDRSELPGFYGLDDLQT